MLELEELKPEVALTKKAANIDDNRRPSRQRRTKEGTTEFEHGNKATINNAWENPPGTGKALEIPVNEKA